ncbi:septum formation initiator family protein [Patescibacteria group bacterium]|nr:septum formation initiator family protein [Patescibacteria group bacterium]
MDKRIFASKPIVVLEIAIIVFFGFHIGKQVLEKRAIQEEVDRLEAEIGKLENKNDDLSALIEYAKTDAFVEQEARQKLNLVKEGESLVLIPDVDAEPDAWPRVGGDFQPKAGNVKLWQEYFFDYDQLWLD